MKDRSLQKEGVSTLFPQLGVIYSDMSSVRKNGNYIANMKYATISRMNAVTRAKGAVSFMKSLTLVWE